MATAYTDLLGLALPVTGELSGTWGDEVSNYITKFLDSAVAGTQVISGSQTAVTLTKTTGANLSQVGSGSSGSSQYAVIRCTGNPASTLTITAPAASKVYAVINATTTGQSVKLVGAGPTTGVTVANGKTAVVVWNGSDFVEVAPAVATNLSGGTAGALPYQTAANTTAFLSIGTNNFVLTSNGTAPVWTTNTGTGNVVRATSPTIDAPTITTSLSASAPIFTTGTISSNAASRLGLQANEIWSWGANASTQGTVTFRLRSSDGSLGSSPVAITSAGMDVTGALTASTSARSPIIIGGTGTTSTLALRSTSGVGTTGADIIFQTGNNGATEAMRILNNGNVGIGTSNPTAKLTISGNISTVEKTSAYIGIDVATSAGNGGNLTIKAGNGFGAGNSSGVLYLAYGRGASTANNGYMAFGRGAPTNAGGLDANGEFMRIDNVGNVGIGTTSPSQKLQAIGAIESTASNAYRGIRLEAGTGIPQTIKAVNYLGVSYTADLAFNTDNNGVDSEKMRILGNGNVGIGTSSPSMTLDVRGASTTTGASRRLVYISDTTTGFAAGVGGGIALAGIINTGGTVATFGGIQAQKESSTEGVQSGYLTLVTNNGSTLVERMRIDSAGNVGIGTSSASVRLQLADSSSTVYTATSAALVAPRGVISAENTSITTGSYSGIALNAKNANNNAAIGYIGVISEPTDYVCDIVFGSRTGATAYAERMRIDSTGNVGIGLTTPVNKLDVSGSFGRGAPVTKTTNFTLAAAENWVICNGAGAITVTLPAASSWTGREVMIKTIAAQTVVSASSNVVPLTGGAAGTAILAATAGKWATLVSDGTNWVIMSAA